MLFTVPTINDLHSKLILTFCRGVMFLHFFYTLCLGVWTGIW